ncbi:MAG: hypothetical protein H0V31_00110 [Acidobacteria bacterium]|jgi:hypothetical protein|nr:hypothetical protein [Acidobacteriota bacterium]
MESTEKPPARCSECDRVMEHYNVFVSPTNVEKTICWECMTRDEKGFFAKRDFSRNSRRGMIPR